ncbi:hypothetical protein [Mesorhizobium sp.]|uniref:hypothetical protein n=1 Tax=Mesorhizobium sp. TaxID=1871066 RepID=UPI0025CF1C09|nr:hypothetical protein [Mesorhizobium sp.]
MAVGAQPRAANLARRPAVFLRAFDAAAIWRCTSALLLTRSAQGLKKNPTSELLAEHWRCFSNRWIATSCRRNCASCGLDPPPRSAERIWLLIALQLSAYEEEVPSINAVTNTGKRNMSDQKRVIGATIAIVSADNLEPHSLLMVNKGSLNEHHLIPAKLQFQETLILVYYMYSRKFNIALLFQD